MSFESFTSSKVPSPRKFPVATHAVLPQTFSSVNITAILRAWPVLFQVFQYALQFYPPVSLRGLPQQTQRPTGFLFHHKYRSDAVADFKGLIWSSSASHQYLLLVTLGESGSHFFLPHGNIAGWEPHSWFPFQSAVGLQSIPMGIPSAPSIQE